MVTPVEPHPYHKELFDALLSLHRDPRGRQMLMVFKTVGWSLQPGDSSRPRTLAGLPTAVRLSPAGSIEYAARMRTTYSLRGIPRAMYGEATAGCAIARRRASEQRCA